MWNFWAQWPSPDARGYLLACIGAYWVGSFLFVYAIGAILLLLTALLSDGWPIWVLIASGGFLWSLPFLVPGLFLLLLGLRMSRG